MSEHGELLLDHTLTGAGSPLVLIHGITENRHAFDPLLPLLEPDFQVLAVDLRGHGASFDAAPYDLETMADDVHLTVRQVWPDGPDPLIVGHSLGGAVATAYAARFPTSGVVNIDQSMDLAGFQAMVRSVEQLLRSEACEQVMVGMFEQMYGALPAAEADRLRAGRVVNQDAVLGVWGLLFDLEPDDLAVHVDRVISAPDVGPYLAVHGVDPGPDYPAWLTGRVPTAQVVVWPELGHYPHLVRPEEFVGLVRSTAGVG